MSALIAALRGFYLPFAVIPPPGFDDELQAVVVKAEYASTCDLSLPTNSSFIAEQPLSHDGEDETAYSKEMRPIALSLASTSSSSARSCS